MCPRNKDILFIYVGSNWAPIYLTSGLDKCPGPVAGYGRSLILNLHKGKIPQEHMHSAAGWEEEGKAEASWAEPISS